MFLCRTKSRWEAAKNKKNKNLELISGSKKERLEGVWCGQRPGRWGWDPAMQPALTDALYIACHFILHEYWGVAKLKPGR